ncbi:cytochrome P450 [Multifurca ochricompacta]|uniref:Cytochrome P450 n=1 Tax=Multifurca ochricompacta TaxID=376703 RepID=A0AAD4LVM5_9AGAM|nr:cytochrome P450 [Multifurca ochricompacta]
MGWVPGIYDPSTYAFAPPPKGSAFRTSGAISDPLLFISQPSFNLSAIQGFLRQTTVGTSLENKTLIIGALLAVITYFIISYVKSPWRKLPPGPRRSPIIGNTFQLLDKKWLLSKDCKGRFGEVMYLDVAGTPVIMFNSFKSAFDVLERSANNYSDRPQLIIPQKLLNKGLLMVFMNYDAHCRRLRRASQAALTKTVVRKYYSILTREATMLASGLLENGSHHDWPKEFQRTTASVIMSILYDYPPLTSAHDKAIEGIETYNDRMTRASAPGQYFVELFPWMMLIPKRFAKWKREGLKHGDEHQELFQGLLNRVKVDLDEGGTRPSFCASLLQGNDRDNLTEPEMAFLAGLMYSAGAETTSTALIWWTLAVVAFPEVQRRAQAELDDVVGRSRLPTFDDAPHLPYVRAIVKEVLRWRPVAPLGVAHAAKEDGWYEGMFIPKGAICMPNVWHGNHDRAVFGDDADEFRPERYIDEKGELITGPTEGNQDNHTTYGFGRRACPGKHLANDALFIDTARTLWAMNLERTRDENGNEMPLDTDSFMDTGVVIRPLPFDLQVTPRFPEVPSILAEERIRYGV